MSHTNDANSSEIMPRHKSDTRCAAGLEFNGGHCGTIETLMAMIEAHNKFMDKKDHIHMDMKLAIDNPHRFKKAMVRGLAKSIGDKCTTHKCWTRQKFIHLMEDAAYEELTKYTHRPDSPQGKFDWLSTFDINDSMMQYEKKYNRPKPTKSNHDRLEGKTTVSLFKFFGAVPMDFALLRQLEIATADYKKLYDAEIRKLGIIFNLDNHDQPGSHWVAMFTDLDKGHIFYFDSYGVIPEPRVRELMRKQFVFMRSIGIPSDQIRVEYNRTQHQRENSECGVYSMNVIIRMLRGDEFVEICKNVVPDKKINKCRLVYFDKYNKKNR